MPAMIINELIEKIETLETRQAFQEDTIESLNSVIIQLNKDVEMLQFKFDVIQEKVKQSSDNLTGTETEEPPPPHY